MDEMILRVAREGLLLDTRAVPPLWRVAVWRSAMPPRRRTRTISPT